MDVFNDLLDLWKEDLLWSDVEDAVNSSWTESDILPGELMIILIDAAEKHFVEIESFLHFRFSSTEYEVDFTYTSNSGERRKRTACADFDPVRGWHIKSFYAPVSYVGEVIPGLSAQRRRKLQIDKLYPIHHTPKESSIYENIPVEDPAWRPSVLSGYKVPTAILKKLAGVTPGDQITQIEILRFEGWSNKTFKHPGETEYGDSPSRELRPKLYLTCICRFKDGAKEQRIYSCLLNLKTGWEIELHRAGRFELKGDVSDLISQKNLSDWYLSVCHGGKCENILSTELIRKNILEPLHVQGRSLSGLQLVEERARTFLVVLYALSDGTPGRSVYTVQNMLKLPVDGLPRIVDWDLIPYDPFLSSCFSDDSGDFYRLLFQKRVAGMGGEFKSLVGESKENGKRIWKCAAKLIGWGDVLIDFQVIKSRYYRYDLEQPAYFTKIADGVCYHKYDASPDWDSGVWWILQFQQVLAKLGEKEEFSIPAEKFCGIHIEKIKEFLNSFYDGAVFSFNEAKQELLITVFHPISSDLRLKKVQGRYKISYPYRVDPGQAFYRRLEEQSRSFVTVNDYYLPKSLLSAVRKSVSDAKAELLWICGYDRNTADARIDCCCRMPHGGNRIWAFTINGWNKPFPEEPTLGHFFGSREVGPDDHCARSMIWWIEFYLEEIKHLEKCAANGFYDIPGSMFYVQEIDDIIAILNFHYQGNAAAYIQKENVIRVRTAERESSAIQ